MRLEKANKTPTSTTTHGMASHKYGRHPIYYVWRNMKKRCLNENNPGYKNYGGRGITICDEWNHDFIEFYKWAIDNGYKRELTIDRIDNDGNYEPDNCRWATRKTQNRNKRDNRIIEYKGKTKILMEWSEIYNIPYYTLKYRINKGWSIERAFNAKKESGKNICV